jgi:UDP-2,4-diacetamido-2,4,6-trideoxy-beta-L-altropyranose hydrolase
VAPHSAVSGFEMILRAARPDDAEELLVWRNDPATRANSLDTELVPLEVHTCWLTSVLNNPNKELLVAELDGESVGTVRIDSSEAHCELSWTVAPEWRQRGIGKKIVAMAMDRARGRLLIAKIKPDNTASQQIVRNLGFTKAADRAGFGVWVYEHKDA